MAAPLEFEKDIAMLESKLDDLRQFSSNSDVDIIKEIERIEKKLQKLMASKYASLSPWEKVQVARHAERPHFKNFLDHLFTDFYALAGDRCFGEDAALLGGLARFKGRSVMVMGHEKGHDTETRIKHNFGMARPEGYRKAVRLMQMAEDFSLPLISFVDTAGAHPGIEAEERGQAEAIARSIEKMMGLKVPVISIVTGEGGSGGAIAIATGNRVLMLEHAIYSVVSPEGCASILWRTSDRRQDAAAAQKFTAQDLLGFGVIDQIINEPLGGAHRNHGYTFTSVSDAIEVNLREFNDRTGDSLKQQRNDRFMKIGRVI